MSVGRRQSWDRYVAPRASAASKKYTFPSHFSSDLKVLLRMTCLQKRNFVIRHFHTLYLTIIDTSLYKHIAFANKTLLRKYTIVKFVPVMIVLLSG